MYVGHCSSVGDFNAHFNFVDTSYPNIDIGVKLFNFLECNNLYQLVDEPTRITRSGESILDLIISDSPGFFISSGTLSPPANCDHNVVYATLNCRRYKPRSFSRKVWNFNNIDIQGVNSALSNANWDSLFCATYTDIDVLYDSFFTLFLGIVESFIPCKNVTVRPRDKPWMMNEICRAICKHDRLLKAYCRSKSNDTWERYRVQRNSVVSLIRAAKISYDAKINQALCDPLISAKRWWGIVKSMYGNKFYSAVPVISEDGILVSDPKKKADLFNKYFASQASVPNSR